MIMRLLLIEDEIQLSEALTEILIKNNYIIDAVYDGEDGLNYGLTGIYDVIITDIMIPKIDGLKVVQKLRNNGIKTPIIMLTAKGTLQDKICGLDCGSDDYLPKPFELEELLARLRALTRRQGEVINDDILSFNDFSLNLATYELKSNENKIKISAKEFEIIRYLLQRPQMVASKDEILIKVWGYDSDAEYNNLEVYISFLRRKLKRIGSKTKIITLRSIGYKLGGEEDV
jgi:DNA-binding response OmpR family regulator